MTEHDFTGNFENLLGKLTIGGEKIPQALKRQIRSDYEKRIDGCKNPNTKYLCARTALRLIMENPSR